MEGERTRNIEAPAQAPAVCSSCFMFFANPAFENLCSQCFKTAKDAPLGDALPSSASDAAAAPVPAVGHVDVPELPQSSTESLEQTIAAPVVAISSESPAPEGPPERRQSNLGRCWTCKKKVVFAKQVTNKCRCEFVFCDQHRQAEVHSCEFDHKTVGRDRIEKSNPVVRADKINRI